MNTQYYANHNGQQQPPQQQQGQGYDFETDFKISTSFFQLVILVFSTEQ